MKYKAIISIGGYNVGDEVPEDKALNWLKCYSVPHVEKVEGNVESPKEKELNLDLNGDGKFDAKDKKIAGKVLASKFKKGRR